LHTTNWRTSAQLVGRRLVEDDGVQIPVAEIVGGGVDLGARAAASPGEPK